MLSLPSVLSARFFFFNDTATTEIYTLSLHDALPICSRLTGMVAGIERPSMPSSSACSLSRSRCQMRCGGLSRSEEHTSELQSHVNLVCRLLLEKKKKQKRE